MSGLMRKEPALQQGLWHDAEHVLRWAGERDAWLACSIGNARAAAFYVKAGWSNVGTETLDLDTSAGLSR